MNDRKCRNCWEYWNCPPETRGNCKVFKENMGNECWFIMHLKKGCPAAAKYNGCTECPWYLKNNPPN